MAAYYGTVVLPARVRKPRDKAKVEAGVLLVERWILASLRHHTFFGLAELNREIRRLLDILNHRPFKKLPGSRKKQFESLDRPALKPLPAEPYVALNGCGFIEAHIRGARDMSYPVRPMVLLRSPLLTTYLCKRCYRYAL